MTETKRVLTPEELFCLQGCGGYSQYFHMRKGFEEGTCSFCNVDRSLNLVLWEDLYSQCWEVPERFKKENVAQHYIVSPKRHVRFPWELKDVEVLSMQVARNHLAAHFTLYGEVGGIIATRFGDMRLNAGTVPHLHENIMVPKGGVELRLPVMKSDEHRENNKKRAEGYSSRYEAGEVPE